MGLLDNLKGNADELKDKAGDFVADHQDQVEGGLDKAGDLIDKATGHKFSDKIDGGVESAKDQLDKLAGDDEPAA